MAPGGKVANPTVWATAAPPIKMPEMANSSDFVTNLDLRIILILPVKIIVEYPLYQLAGKSVALSDDWQQGRGRNLVISLFKFSAANPIEVSRNLNATG